MQKFVLTVIAIILKRRVVALQDFDMVVSYSLAYDTPFGLMAERYWPFNIRKVLLVEDGTIKPNTYVIRWKYV